MKEIGKVIKCVVIIFISFSIMALMLNSFVYNLSFIHLRNNSVIVAQKTIEKFRKNTQEDEVLNEKVMKIDDGYLAKNYKLEESNYSKYMLDIYIKDITKLDKKYSQYEKGLVKQAEIKIKYEYKNKQYTTSLKCIIRKNEEM